MYNQGRNFSIQVLVIMLIMLSIAGQLFFRNYDIQVRAAQERRTVSVIRLATNGSDLYGILVNGLGYGVEVSELLDPRTELVVFNVGSYGEVKWLKRLDERTVYKSRGVATWDRGLLLAYTTIDELGSPRLVVLLLSSDGELLDAISLDVALNTYLGIPGFVNDLRYNNGYIFISGGWHLYAQRYPYNISPFLYVIDIRDRTGWRITLTNTSGFKYSGGLYSVDVYGDRVYICGGVFDLYYDGSRVDFVIASIYLSGELEWIIAFDFYMGMDYCRATKRVGDYIYAVGRSWLNGLGDHVIFVKIRSNGSVEEVKALGMRAEPVSMGIYHDKLIILAGHSPTAQLIVIDTNGEIVNIQNLTKVSMGLDLVIHGDELFITGAVELIGSIEESLPIYRLSAEDLEELMQQNDGNLISNYIRYEEHFDINYVQEGKLQINVEPVYPSSYNARLLSIMPSETKRVSTGISITPTITAHTEREDNTHVSTNPYISFITQFTGEIDNYHELTRLTSSTETTRHALENTTSTIITDDSSVITSMTLITTIDINMTAIAPGGITTVIESTQGPNRVYQTAESGSKSEAKALKEITKTRTPSDHVLDTNIGISKVDYKMVLLLVTTLVIVLVIILIVRHMSK